MTEHNDLIWQVDDGVGVLTLNRPGSMNALRSATLEELAAVVRQAEHDPSVRAVLVTGAGRAFCAGADVNEWADDDGDSTWVPMMHDVMTRLYWLPKPVVAAVNGVAVGAGCDLSLVADLRIASDKARFGEAYIRLGFCPDAGGSYLLPRIVGEARAMEMIYTGRIVEAAEALDIGLVSRVVEHEKFMDAALEQARQLASGPTVAIGLAKQNIRKNHTATFEEALRTEGRGGAICAQTRDHVEALKASVDKRAPEFTGR
ncbi:enoyl-CoA hydratase/isomerase family protein [Actinomadura nitritigenes]|uniref:enoyl-CoA hydratase/isomerase family protein n=1 Tax=Actinomadura nitritigenes TaxID=134602 RepID=UPI003D8A9D2B